MENTDKNEIYKNIKNGLANLSQNELEEIFKIVYKNNNNYSKNNNGIFINLCWLDNDTLTKINNYINFCIKSHNEINKYEDICNMLNDTINNKDIINTKRSVQYECPCGGRYIHNNKSQHLKTKKHIKYEEEQK
jgi:hypothetical protein